MGLTATRTVLACVVALAVLGVVLLAQHNPFGSATVDQPGAPPMPEWDFTEPPYVVADSGVQLAALRVVINPAHVTALFFAIGLFPELASWTATPTDLRIIDQSGY